MSEIQTLEDWIKVLSCCCPPPSCPIPLETCKSINGQLTSQGFIDPEATSWMRYLKFGMRKWINTSGSENGTLTGYGTYLAATHTANAETFQGNEYARLYYGGVGCVSYPAEGYTTHCEGTGTATTEFFDVKTWGTGIPPGPGLDPVVNYVYDQTSTYTASFSSAEGLETEEHQAWEMLFPTPEAFEAAMDLYEAYLADYAQYELDLAAWYAGGSIGDPPAEPDVVEEPPAEPEEFYGPCVWLITQTIEIEDHWFGYYWDGTSAAPALDQDALDAWWQDPGVSDPPCPGTSVITSIETVDPLSFMLRPSCGVDSGDINTDASDYRDGVTLAEWQALAESVIEGDLNFDDEECLGELCTALRQEEGASDVPGDNASLILQAVQVSWEVDDSHGGTVFHLLFDVLEEPVASDPSFIAEDVARDWIGPGTGLQNDPSWDIGTPYVIDPPAVPGERRIVNRRFWCYPNSPYGYKPQVTGEGVELP